MTILVCFLCWCDNTLWQKKKITWGRKGFIIFQATDHLWGNEVREGSKKTLEAETTDAHCSLSRWHSYISQDHLTHLGKSHTGWALLRRLTKRRFHSGIYEQENSPRDTASERSGLCQTESWLRIEEVQIITTARMFTL